MSYVEVHFHLLPGVDDGPASIERASPWRRLPCPTGRGPWWLLRTCAPSTSPIPARFPVSRGSSQFTWRGRVSSFDLLPGGELAHEMMQCLTNRQLEAVSQGPGKSWLLLEAPFNGLDVCFTAAADEFRDRGFAVGVAHPERAMQSHAAADALEHELAAGSALQLTHVRSPGNMASMCPAKRCACCARHREQ